MLNKTFLQDELNIDGIYTLYYQKKEEGFFFPGEIHSFWELVYMDSGSICLMLDGNEYLLDPGDFMFYTENQNHIFWSDKKSAPCFLTVSFDIEFTEKDFYKNRVFKADKKVRNIFSEILNIRDHAFTGDRYHNFTGEKPGCNLLKQYLKILLNELMLYLYVGYNQDMEYKKDLNSENSFTEINPLVKKSIGYIQNNIMNKLYIDEICAHIAASRTYFSKIFKQHTGLSAIEFINAEKLKKARQIIRDTEISITMIADSLGFSSVYYFSNLFKQKYGISPLQYRKSIL